MSKRRRVDPGALRRDQRRHQERQRPALLRRIREAVLPAAAYLFAAFEVARVATAPIRGTTAWLDGLLIGYLTGAVTYSAIGLTDGALLLTRLRRHRLG